MEGQRLSRGYFDDVVAPLLARRFRSMPYAAGRLGSGSDVLGLDDRMSQDHDFGLRLTLLTPAARVAEVESVLERELPAEHQGRPTRFATTFAPEIRHRVEVSTAADFAFSRLGIDATAALTANDWMSLTGQAVLEVIGGPVFVDSAGELTGIRERLHWYPHDVWLHLLACDWAQACEELPYVGRAGARGDDLGSRVLAARLVQVGMRIGFLLERRWAPYGKWFGSAFARLPRASAALPGMTAALAAGDWQSREEALARAFTELARVQSGIGLPVVEPVVVPFFDRPFRGLADLPAALLDCISDPQVRALPYGVGSAEQVTPTVRVLVDGPRRARMLGGLTAPG